MGHDDDSFRPQADASEADGKGGHGVPAARPGPVLPAGGEAQELAAALQATGAGIVVTDERLCILAVNGAYARAVGRTAAELRGTGLPAGLAYPTPGAGPFEQEVMLRHRNGHEQPAWMRTDMLHDERGALRRRVFTFTDISTLMHERAMWRHRAEHDALTGLPNRALFDAELERCMARASRHGRAMALMFIDIDHFKRVNDHLGHGVGDALLREFGQQLRRTLRAEDVVARLGGDEFVAVLEDLDDDDASAPATSVLGAVTRCFVIDGRALQVSASIGIAIYPRDATDAAQLMRAADAAMYLAKQAGRARLHHCTRAASAPVDGPPPWKEEIRP